MKFVRFLVKECDIEIFGVLHDQIIQTISGDPLTDWEYSGMEYHLDSVRLLSPIIPCHIIGIGTNYIEPGKARPESIPEMPLLFYKPSTTVVGPEDDIILPPAVSEVKFESELAVIIGKMAKDVAKEDIFDYIFGYTVANDVTAPSLFHPNGHWTIGKSVDTFTPLGPVIETDLDLKQIRIRSLLNGEEKQNSGLDNIIVEISDMISYISRYTTLFPGDVILTGAPAGATFMKNGDVIECIVDGIGTLRNKVRY